MKQNVRFLRQLTNSTKRHTELAPDLGLSSARPMCILSRAFLVPRGSTTSDCTGDFVFWSLSQTYRQVRDQAQNSPFSCS